jgi:hypothetical protein
MTAPSTMLRPSLLSFAACLATLITSSLAADTLTFQDGLNGYASTADTYINSQASTTANGSAGTLITKYTSNSSAPDGGFIMARELRTILLRFDDLNLSNFTVSSASINLTVAGITANSGGQANIFFSAYELQKGWTENAATWTMASFDAWTTAGAQSSADRTLTPFFTTSAYSINGTSGSTPVLSAGDTITISLSAGVVQSWIDNPTSNLGILVDVWANSQYRYPEVSFYSSEDAGASNRPTLVINGTSTIPEPTTYTLLAATVCFAAGLARRHCGRRGSPAPQSAS